MFYLKKILLCIFIFFVTQSFALAELPHYVDFKYVLNESAAGKKAQTFLKKTLDDSINSLNKREKSILQEEKKIIEQKKIISVDEYKKKVTDLRKKVSSLRKERKEILESISKKRNRS